jgi:hypothetical protein
MIKTAKYYDKYSKEWLTIDFENDPIFSNILDWCFRGDPLAHLELTVETRTLNNNGTLTISNPVEFTFDSAPTTDIIFNQTYPRTTMQIPRPFFNKMNSSMILMNSFGLANTNVKWLSGPCVVGDCIVDTARGQIKISELKKGDEVFHSQGKSTVMCLIEHYVGFEDVDLIVMGRNNQLKITPWHPIRIPETGNVVFPMEYQDEVITVERLKSIFNVVMVPGDEPWYSIGGIDVVSFGHGNMDDPVLRHPYYAVKILDDLKLLEGWDNGYVNVTCKKIRDKDTGLVSGHLYL